MKQILWILVAGLGGLGMGCQKAPPVAKPSFTVEGGRLWLRSDSRFAKNIEMVRVVAAPKGSTELRAIGQIVALANPSGALTGKSISWVELYPELSKTIGLNLNQESYSHARVGLALGFTSLSSEYLGRIKVGQRLEVTRYGLRQSPGARPNAVITAVHLGEGVSGLLYVIFSLSEGSDWYPGTNCEVGFPFVQSKPVEIPTTALLHEGMKEYVLKQTAPGELVAVNVHVVQDTPDTVGVLGLSENDSIVGPGAILLKPELHLLLNSVNAPNQLKGDSYAP